MFEVGFTEIVLILGIALLVLGPARLPKLAADVGRWAGKARAMARQLKTQLEQEANFDPLRDTAQTIHTPPPRPAQAPAANPSPAPAGAHAPTREQAAQAIAALGTTGTDTAAPAAAADQPTAAPDTTDESKPA